LLLVWLAGAGAACDVNVGDGNFQLGLASGKATDTWTRSYTLASGGAVEIVNVNGQVSVEPSEKDTVEVRAERTAKSSTDEAAKALLAKIDIHETVTPTRIQIETRAPKTSGRDSHEVKYFVKIPPGSSMRARTTNGGIQLAKLTNDVVAMTVNGGVKGQDLSGSVDATTTNGGVEVSVTDVGPKGLRLESTNGGVTLAVPRTVHADVSARVLNGGMHVGDDLSLTVTGERSRRHLEGQLNGGGPRIELATTNGGIHIGARQSR
jgi:DUF4097 and DUF4098 domain-containing protein YvlB